MAKTKEVQETSTAISVRNVAVTFESTTPLSWSKKIPKAPPNTDQMEWEEKHWRGRVHVANGEVVIPCLAFRDALESAAKGRKIPGKSNATYTALVRSAITPLTPYATTGIKIEDVQPEWLFVPGAPGSGSETRVDKCFPNIAKWSSKVDFVVLDAQITPAVFEDFMARAGLLVGVGRWRPERGGLYGRFRAKTITWS